MMIKVIRNPWIWITGMLLLNLAEAPVNGAFAKMSHGTESQIRHSAKQVKSRGILMPSGAGSSAAPKPSASPTPGPIGILMPSGAKDEVIYQEEENPSLLPQAESKIYSAQCSFCHAPKPANTLPNMTAWIKLLYTSGCPQVTIKLDDSQRRAIKTYLDAAIKNRSSH